LGDAARSAFCCCRRRLAAIINRLNVVAGQLKDLGPGPVAIVRKQTCLTHSPVSPWGPRSHGRAANRLGITGLSAE
jgi:hypothetical protein